MAATFWRLRTRFPPETPDENIFAMYQEAGISREEIFDRAAQIRRALKPLGPRHQEGHMKIDRREFITLVGASVASSSPPLFSDVGGNLDAPATLERNGWRLQVTPAGEMVSFTDGKLELVNRRLGDNRPQVMVGGTEAVQLRAAERGAAGGRGADLPIRFYGPGKLFGAL